jgi:hypothetical protein
MCLYKLHILTMVLSLKHYYDTMVGVVVGMGLTVLPRSSVEVFGQFFRWLQQQRRLGHQQCI